MPFPEWFHDLARSVNNWGRWGPDDQIGTINLIDADATRRGASAVRVGRSLSLALPLSEAEGIQLGFMPGRLNPTRTMAVINMAITGDPSMFCTSDDLVVMGLQAATHWDGLGHVSYDGRLYNGFPASAVTASGAGQCGIHHIRSIVTRGVLLDVARAKGVDRLEAGYAITGDDLDEASEFAKVSVQPGDVVLIRTGQMQHLRPGASGGAAPDKMAYSMGAAGPSTKSVPWLRRHDVAAVATDNLAFEVFPCEFDDAFLPVHPLHLVEMGLTQGQNWQLEDLSADCADDGVYDFLLEASPQPFTNAVGSPVNPVATK